MGKEEIVWDLSEMFPSTTDPSVQKAIDGLTQMARGFASRYQQARAVDLHLIEYKYPRARRKT